MCEEAAVLRVKAQRGDGVEGERVGSGKRAVEGLQDPLKHLNADGGRQARAKGQVSNGAETGMRWKRVKSSRRRYSSWEHREQSVDGERGDSTELEERSKARTTREGVATWGREEAPVWPLPAGGWDGLLRCDWEEATSGTGGKELRAR